MNAPQLSQLSVNCDTITPLLAPVEFDCTVQGRKLKATITHQEDNGVHYIYHIAFSDGHAATFVAPMESGLWHASEFASPYAKAIHDDLDAFCAFRPSRPPFAIRLKNDLDAFNVWIVPHGFKANYYSIFYKGDYRFDLRKTAVWEAQSVRENTAINQEIATLVCKNIEKRLLQPQLF